MNYKQKTIELENIIEELNNIIDQFPLLTELIKKREKIKREYYARINYNLMVYGETKLKFDDIDY